MKLKKKLSIYFKKQIYLAGYQIKKANNFIFLDSLLYKLISIKGHINFIQIVGNDGINDDPLHNFIVWNNNRVSGLILEPVKDYYKELEKTYSKFPFITTLNLAIHNYNNEMIINKVKSESLNLLPKSTKGIASFYKNHHLNCKVSSEHIIEENVKCITLKKLLLNENISTIDLLQIDTEGYDADIILNIDFDHFKPSIINFEYYVPNTMSKDTLNNIIELLHKHGYEIWTEINDITAYQRDLFIKID
ncbi:FkbM family methyltransferase [Flavobacterium sp. XS2P14]|uniref:FkbM family methyltransferase n=1 Tax=Flavobacterium sp. XS2P14 TaxID=3401735 RepID=UPI003AAAD21C